MTFSLGLALNPPCLSLVSGKHPCLTSQSHVWETGENWELLSGVAEAGRGCVGLCVDAVLCTGKLSRKKPWVWTSALGWCNDHVDPISLSGSLIDPILSQNTQHA